MAIIRLSGVRGVGWGGRRRGGGRHSGGFNWRGVIYRRRAPPLSDYGAAPAPNYFKLNLAKSNRKRKDRAARRPGRGGRPRRRRAAGARGGPEPTAPAPRGVRAKRRLRRPDIYIEFNTDSYANV